MSRSKDLYLLQEYDARLDAAKTRIRDIDQVLGDDSKLRAAQEILSDTEEVLAIKYKEFKRAEAAVADHNVKIDQNQKRLYSGAVTNPKELEDLQLESESLQRYLSVLEDRQLESMLEMEEAENEKHAALDAFESTREEARTLHGSLLEEKTALEKAIETTKIEKEKYLNSREISDLSIYSATRKSSGGIAVALMVADSCTACGANIPSAIAQEARSPGKLVFCPTCRRVLHPG